MPRENIDVHKAYEKLLSTHKRYMVMDEKYYKLIALWEIGTYFHKNFETFPYLFINAVKGSGKTRLLKLITFFAKNGNLIALPSQAYLFREAETETFCIDELESIDRKESFELRLLLNTAYKKGLFVPRMKTENGKIVSEKFETFSPIAIANIWGLDDVLHDRAIDIRLEKVENARITKKIEAWDKETEAKEVKEFLNQLGNMKEPQFAVEWGNIENIFRNITSIWNDFLESMENEKDSRKAMSNLDWLSGKYRIEPNEDIVSFFSDIAKSKIDGRELELFLPLIVMARLISENLYKEIIAFAEESTIERAEIDITENKDSQFTNVMFNFIQGKEPTEFYSIGEFVSSAVDVIGEERNTKNGIVWDLPKYFNNRFVGKALERNHFVMKRKRLNTGNKVMLNFGKITQRAKMLGIELEEKQTTLKEPIKDKPDLKDYAENP